MRSGPSSPMKGAKNSHKHRTERGQEGRTRPPNVARTLPLVVVHRVDLRCDADAGGLSLSERARAARLKGDARRSFIACRVALRCLLAERVGAAPDEVILVATGRGKPRLPGGEVSFNVSHSGDIGLVALAEGEHRLGIDVQRTRERLDVVAFTERFLHPVEATAVAGRKAPFVRCWTRKEAVVKAIGDGLWHPLDSFAVDVDAQEPSRVLGLEGLIVVPLVVEPGYEAAVAVDEPATVVWAR